RASGSGDQGAPYRARRTAEGGPHCDGRQPHPGVVRRAASPRRRSGPEQRRLVDDAARAAFEEAELAEPTGALRDDVTGTLQAAVADPDVASRLGRLTKAERWSGFGEFGDTAMVFTATRKTSTAS